MKITKIKKKNRPTIHRRNNIILNYHLSTKQKNLKLTLQNILFNDTSSTLINIIKNLVQNERFIIFIRYPLIIFNS